MPTPVMESYLETIYNLTMEGERVIAARLASHFKLTAPTVSETLHRMVEHGYIAIGAQKVILLTPEGRSLAEEGLRRHRLLERFLAETLGLDWVTSHEEAHRLEHHLSPAVEERMRRLLGDPETCPHGNPIPAPGRDPTAFLRERHALRLSRAKPGTTVRVLSISEIVEDESALLRLLSEHHIMPGGVIETLVPEQPFQVRFSLEGETVHLSRQVADKIWVQEQVPGRSG